MVVGRKHHLVLSALPEVDSSLARRGHDGFGAARDACENGVEEIVVDDLDSPILERSGQ